jgi:hypothetical protein
MHRLHVIVVFPAAAAPFQDKDADPAETLGHLKQRVLDVFGLKEGATSDGSIITYQLYQHKTLLEDMNQTLGQRAGDAPTLQLKLAQQITQG